MRKRRSATRGRSMARIQRRIVAPSGVPPPSGKYSHAVAVRASELLFIAGQTSRDDQGELIGAGDAAAQTRRAFELIGLILSEAGADFSNVVEFTTYIVGRDSVDGFIEARRRAVRRVVSRGRLSTEHIGQHRVAGRDRGACRDKRNRGSAVAERGPAWADRPPKRYRCRLGLFAGR